MPEARSLAPAWGTDLPLPQKLREALARGTLESLAGADACPVPVRVYGVAGGKTPFILLHGLQSHAGWFAQSAAFLGGLGHPTYAIDRRGSGVSPARCGDVKNYQTWSAEIRRVTAQVQRRHGHPRLYVLGHCFGAIPAAVFAAGYPQLVKGLLLTTPALHTRIGLPAAHLARILLTLPGRRNYYLPVPLRTEWFSDQPSWQHFIGADPLALRAATGDFYWQVYLARRHLRNTTGSLALPLWVGTAGNDPIADNRRNLAWIGRLPAPAKTLVHYAGARHILEFSRERARFFNDLAAWLGWMENL